MLLWRLQCVCVCDNWSCGKVSDLLWYAKSNFVFLQRTCDQTRGKAPKGVKTREKWQLWNTLEPVYLCFLLSSSLQGLIFNSVLLSVDVTLWLSSPQRRNCDTDFYTNSCWWFRMKDLSLFHTSLEFQSDTTGIKADKGLTSNYIKASKESVWSSQNRFVMQTHMDGSAVIGSTQLAADGEEAFGRMVLSTVSSDQNPPISLFLFFLIFF